MKFMAADDTLGAFINELFAGVDDEVPLQEFRRGLVHKRMKDIASAANRAAGLVMGIIRQHEDRMQFDDEFQLVIAGRLAIYRVDINAFINKFVNPFDYNSFDVVEVHPKSGLVNEPKTACVQVQPQKNMPACDLLAGYILGLLNDDVTWLQESLTPLRRTLFQIYGLAQSPLTASMQKHFAEEVDGVFDFKTDTFTFAGTNGWMWRLHFGQPLTKGCKVEYRKPRQWWWNPLFDDIDKESTGHYALSGFFETVEHLSACPALLRNANEWQTDPIFMRKVATDYPPLAKTLVHRLTSDSYDPDGILCYYDEPISHDQADTIRLLDEMVLERALA